MPSNRLSTETTSTFTPPATSNRWQSALLIAAGALTLALPAQSADWPPTFEDTSHPLIGRLWSIEQQAFVSIDQALAAVERPVWILLGENHENSDHHLSKRTLIDYLAEREQLGSVAFEMANTNQQAQLDVYLGAQPSEIQPTALNWNPGWSWEAYGPVVQGALARAERVIATDLPREQQMAAYQDPDNFPAPSEAYRAFMHDLLFESHCGHLPVSQLDNMLAVQIARDQSMARQLEAHTGSSVNLMITGRIHARYDLGIPLAKPELNSLSILMIPTDESTDPLDYLPESYSQEAPADLILFTPQQPAQDFCGRITPSHS